MLGLITQLLQEFTVKQIAGHQLHSPPSSASVMTRYLQNPLRTFEENDALSRRGFTIGKKIGSGSYGIVYQGKYMDSETAIKAINVPCATVAYVIIEMFILKKIRHPNVVRLIDFFLLESGNLLIFMEYLSGDELRRLLVWFESQLPEVQVARLYAQFGSGLAFMHNRGFAHRDLKPENILLTEDQTVAKLADFGLSKQCYDTYTGEPIKIVSWAGSATYMAPEVMYIPYIKEKISCCFSASRPIPYCPFLADIWSMGIICFEMLHGNKVYPFNISANLEVDVLYPKICRVPGKLNKRFEQKEVKPLSDETKKFVARHLTVKQQDRPDMDELLEDKWILNNQN